MSSQLQLSVEIRFVKIFGHIYVSKIRVISRLSSFNWNTPLDGTALEISKWCHQSKNTFSEKLKSSYQSGNNIFLNQNETKMRQIWWNLIRSRFGTIESCCGAFISEGSGVIYWVVFNHNTTQQRTHIWRFRGSGVLCWVVLWLKTTQ